MSSFNSDVVGKVIEEQEEDVAIENMVREKILRKVKHAVGAQEVSDTGVLKVGVKETIYERLKTNIVIIIRFIICVESSYSTVHRNSEFGWNLR